MKERPILFSGPMVLAILGGKKTVTRRVIKHQPDVPVTDAIPCRDYPHGPATIDWYWRPRLGHLNRVPSHGWDFKCPYGQPGDRLWVRETTYAWGRWETRFSAKKGRDEWHFVDMTLECGKQYRYPASMMGANAPRPRSETSPMWWKRPAIHGPRVASRILLEITDVRVERLKDISEEQSRAEGVKGEPCDHARQSCGDIGCWGDTAKGAFGFLWESLNGEGSWAANPWVWVVEFKQVMP